MKDILRENDLAGASSKLTDFSHKLLIGKHARDIVSLFGATYVESVDSLDVSFLFGHVSSDVLKALIQEVVSLKRSLTHPLTEKLC